MTGRKPRAKDGVKLKDAGEPRWLVMVPWLAVDTLSVFDLAVLIHIKRITLEHGECYTSNRTLAQKIGCSVSQLKKSKASLEAAGFITVEYERNEAGIINKPATITPVNVWPKNNALYDKLYKKQGENPSHQVTTPSHQKATRGHRKTAPRPPGDTKENIHEEKKDSDANASGAPVPEKPKRERKPKVQKERERNLIFDAVAQHIYGVDPLKVKNGGQIGPSAAVFKQHNVTDPEVVRQFVEWWKQKYPHADAPRNPDRLEVRLLEYLEHYSPAVASANGASSNWMREL